MPIYTFSEYKSLQDKNLLKRDNFTNPLTLNGAPLKFETIDVWDQLFTDYSIACYGVLENGIKTKLIIKNINVCFDVLVPPNEDIQQFYNKIGGLLQTQNIEIKSCKVLNQYVMTGFNPKPLPFLRLSFSKLKDRNSAIKLCNQSKYMTAFDDGGNFRPPHAGYPLKVAREYKINMAGLNLIKKYKIVKEPHAEYFNNDKFVKCNYVYILEANIEDIEPIPLLSTFKSKAIIALCDIETYCHPSRSFPNSEQEEDEIFIISTSFCQMSTVKPLANLIIYQVGGRDGNILADYKTDTIIIRCQTEREVLEMFIDIYSNMLPDYWIDFNGLGFDQKYFYNRLLRYKVEYEYWSDAGRFTTDFSNAKTNLTLLDKFKNGLELPFSGYNQPFINKFMSNWSNRFIKVRPDKSVTGHSFILPGMFYIDAMPILMRANDKESESSLKHFLKIMGLPPKHDMPALAMFRLFENPHTPYILAGKTYTFKALIEYASYDAESVHAMFMKQTIYMRCIANAILTEATLLDSYYHAGGMKARNMIMSEAYNGVIDFDGSIVPVAFSVKGIDDEEEEHYKPPGAYVKPPVFSQTGRTPYPVAPLDFASLYPSIIMGYNISYEKIIYDEKKAESLSRDYKIVYNEFPYGPSICKSWIVQYKFDSNGKELGMGVLAVILDKLKIKRDGLKAEMKAVDDQIDNARKNNLETEDLLFQRSVINAMQLELKIQMNTFYGETGNSKSPFFFVNMTGAITSIGQNLWQYVAGLIEGKGFTVLYGDTDSVYSYAPPSVFKYLEDWYAECVAGNITSPPQFAPEIIKWAQKTTKNPLALVPAWASHDLELHPDIFGGDVKKKMRLLKEELYARMVIIAQYAAAELENYVNSELINYTGTKRLSMAYEEVLFPCSFFGKKKYLGVQNIKPDRRLIGFNWAKKEHRFIKGIDFIKRGNAPIMKEIGEELILTFLDIMEERTVKQIIEEQVRSYSEREWSPKSFIQTAEYKPDKQNVKVHTFVKRMRRATMEQDIKIQEAADKGLTPPPTYYRIPLAGERFEFVIVKKSDTVSTYGYKMNISVGDKMEFPEVAEAFNYKIDIDQYIKGSIVGLLARFISYDNSFRNSSHLLPIVRDDDDDDDEDDDVSDAAAINLAKKAITALIKGPIDKNTIKEVKKQSKAVVDEIVSKAGDPKTFGIFTKISTEIDKHAASGKEAPIVKDIVCSMAKEDAKKYVINSLDFINKLKKRQIDINQLHKLYNSRFQTINEITIKNLCQVKQDILINKETSLVEELNSINGTCTMLNNKFINMVNNGELEKMEDNELQVVDRLFNIYNDLVGIYSILESLSSTSKYITFNRTGLISKPPF